MPGGGGHSGTGRDRGGPGGASKSGPDKGGRKGGGGGMSGSGRPVGSTANQSSRISDFEKNKMGGANTSMDIDTRVNDYLGYEKPGIVPQVLDFMTGPWFDIPAPTFTKPQTYYGGTWHSQTNVPGVVGGLLGGALGGPLGGQLGSLAGSQIGSATGFGQVPHQPWSGDSLSAIAESGGLGSVPGISGGGSPKGPSSDGKQGEGKDPGFWNIANALSSGTQPNPQPSGAVTPQPTYVPAIQAPQPPAPWHGVPAQYPNMNAPKQPVQNYPGMRWIGGGMASRPLYG